MDRTLYKRAVQSALSRTPNLETRAASVHDLVLHTSSNPLTRKRVIGGRFWLGKYISDINPFLPLDHDLNLSCESSGLDRLRNPGMTCQKLTGAIPELEKLDPKALERVDIEGQYMHHLKRQEADIRAFTSDEMLILDPSLDYDSVVGLSTEVRERLKRTRPGNIGIAKRMEANLGYLEIMEGESGKRPGLNLLSLGETKDRSWALASLSDTTRITDDGGIMGLSSLLIIKEMMARLQVKDQRLTMPKPCEYFDMIGGTGTGAISAIMLGRLRMSIGDAIDSYVQLMRTVFSERKYTIKGDTGAFKSTLLERGLKEIIFREVRDQNEKMMEPVQQGEMFKSIEIDIEGTGLRNMFTHGGLGCTNPTPRLLEEAKQVYPGRAVASITSIGTGRSKTIQVDTQHRGNGWVLGGSMMMRVMQAAHEMAEGSERVAEEMARRFAEVRLGYYRLNVQQGTQGINASEWERLDEVAAHTRAYLDQTEIRLKLDGAVELISQGVAVLDTTYIDGHITRVLEPACGGIRSCPPSSIRFTGREKHIGRVRTYFSRASPGRYVFVLYGLGGAGKTQIALRCVEELRDRRRGHSCLLVLDNADDPKVNLQIYLPQSADYNVLITTRCPEFAALTSDNDAVCNVSGLEEDEAVELLMKSAKLRLNQMSEVDKATMYELLKSFKYLALAVVQSAAYIWKMQLSVSQYWERYSTHRHKVLEGGAGPGLDGYARTVHTTWELSLNQLSPYAQELLFLISFLHRDEILEEIFKRAACNLDKFQPDPLSPPDQLAIEQKVKQFLSHLAIDGKWNTAFMDHIGELMSFSLITYNQGSQVYSVHPLVQDWAQAAAPRQYISRQHSALLLALSIDWGRSSLDYAYKRQILPHVNLATEHNCPYNINTPDRFAEVYRATGQYRDEAKLWEHNISVRKQHLGGHHPRTLAAMSSLGRAYQEQRRLTEAKELLETTLTAQKRATGEEHPDTLKTMHYLAVTLDRQCHHAVAEALLNTVVTVRKQTLGEAHPDTLESMDDLAAAYKGQGRLADAETLRMAVLATRKQVLGEDHVDTLEGMDNLASIYQSQGRLTEAKALYTIVVAAWKRVLGDDHPTTLTSIHNLALTCRQQGRLAEAEALYATLVTSEKRMLGEDHPDTLRSIHNLALTYRKQGRLSEAEALYETVITARKRVLGADHPDTLTSMSNLACAYYLHGCFVEAEELFTEVLAGCRRVLGPTHSDTIQAMRDLEDTYSMLGKTVDCNALQRERAAILSSQPL
ncbi:hypothetical protein FRC11_003113 [Ceratobasidium sp. 423]|nr:hypothetical protein FRC11_003113 [Ceratobasidium sp. 423]